MTPSRPSPEHTVNDRTFADLRPRSLDEITLRAYERRRGDDLARAFATPRTTPRTTPTTAPPPARRAVPRRRPVLLLTGTAAAGLAAAAIAVVPAARTEAPAPGTPAPGTPAAGATAGTPSPSRTLDAHALLLAAAATAAREPSASGRFWYTREHVSQLVRVVPGEYDAAIRKLAAEERAKRAELKDRPAELKAYEKDFDKRVFQLKTAPMPYAAATATVEESWAARHGAGRVDVVEGPSVSFATPEDEAKWKAAGSPELTEKRPASRSTEPRLLSVDNPSLTMADVGRLPTGRDALARRLRELYRQSPAVDGRSYASYLWSTGFDLLTAPITPGTRAALFRVLADQPGIVSQGRTADALGRPGVALTLTEQDEVEGRVDYRMILDEGTARLLQFDVVVGGGPLPALRETYEDMGWVGRLGEHPRS
ncbi:hypothetical protein GCM10009530_76500 [Microbispora corallina]|uniref:CU044_5270 family protein n=1 Tax=Microbispora corallina TaxID=83302 RepID=A0ABQ4GBQ5_9ACTN|nr:hypothetical protein [Microbispora corallina]GIH44516.1 hypothetical protein Mco01_75160 [Microbispora corallina]